MSRQKKLLGQRDAIRMNWIVGVSHDIRTPLSIVLGYSDELEQDERLLVEVRKKMDIIRTESLRIKNLINDLNLISELNYDGRFFHVQRVYPAKFLRGLIVEYMNKKLENSYSFEFAADEAALSVFINGDARLLNSAVRNLIQNSMNHNPQGCNIMVRLERKPEWLRITVSDDGKGVSGEKLLELNHMPLYIDSTDVQMNLRHGLGIMITRKIVDHHHGQIHMESAEGRGFSTVLSFPFALSGDFLFTTKVWMKPRVLANFKDNKEFKNS